jgi:hypothetical protein
VVTVNDVLDGHVTLDLECLDRVYLTEYVPNLQLSAQVVSFLTAHLGFPIPSPAIFDQIGGRFRRAVATFARVRRSKTRIRAVSWAFAASYGPQQTSPPVCS